MKKLLIALVVSVFIAGQVLTPAAAASSASARMSGLCGDTYTVQHKDNLSKIAQHCGVTIGDILVLNPHITNPNVIYTGQVLRLAGSPATASTGTPSISLSATSADSGDTITVYVSGFPANSSIDYRIGQEDEDYTDVYDGTIDSEGKAHITITIPYDANRGEYWVVLVCTTSQNEGVQVYSHTIYITG